MRYLLGLSNGHIVEGEAKCIALECWVITKPRIIIPENIGSFLLSMEIENKHVIWTMELTQNETHDP